MKEQRRKLRPLQADPDASAAERLGTMGVFTNLTGGSTPSVLSSRNPVVPQCAAYHGSGQTIGNGAWVSCSMASELYDYGTPTEQHSTSSNTSRLTCVVPGLYHVNGQLKWAAGTAGVRQAGVFANGGTSVNDGWYQGVDSSAVAEALSPSGLFRLDAGDYVELRAFQSNVGAGLAISGQRIAWAFLSP